MSMICRENVPAYETIGALPIASAPERQPWLTHPSLTGGRHSAPLWIQGGKARNLKSARPIQVVIFSENGWIFAENDSLGVAGTGRKLSEALDDLTDSILHLHRHYKALAFDQVTGDGVRLKKLFDELFEEAR